MSDDKAKSALDTAPLEASAEAPAARRPGRARRRAILLVYGRDDVAAVPFGSGSAGVVVGREPPADVVLLDTCISRRHARFSVLEGQIIVEDLGSTNGTFVAGRRVDRAVVRPDDEVRLGAVEVSVQMSAGAGATEVGVEDHDAFRGALTAEIERARLFGRTLAVLSVTAPRRGEGSLRRFYPRVRELLRPVDRIALYGPETVEILLPEASLEEARATASAITERRDGEPALACGVAVFPGAAASADELIEVSRDAARRAGAGEPVQVAPVERAKMLMAGADPATSAAGGKGIPGSAPSRGEPALPEGQKSAGNEEPLIAEGPLMRSVIEMATRLSRSPIAVLLYGETGSGKEVLARFIHGAGPRRDRPMMSVNCGGIPVQLVESTLFGHERGAFSGAFQQQKGVFEAASGGTVLLDEIGELSLPAQAALLRVLETKRVVRVGSTKEIAVDVRVLAATHRDLEAMCEAGAFREDLLFRLNAMTVQIPPLRARREDIPRLAERFLRRAGEVHERRMRGIDPEALALLEGYSWPGNVRELRNAIDRAVIIAEGDVIMARDLPDRIRLAEGVSKRARVPAAPALSSGSQGAQGVPGAADAEAGRSLRERMRLAERQMLIDALRDAGGNLAKVARSLDVPLRTLQHKIREHDIRKHLHYEAGEPKIAD